MVKKRIITSGRRESIRAETRAISLIVGGTDSHRKDAKGVKSPEVLGVLRVSPALPGTCARGRCALRVPDPAHPARFRDRGTSAPRPLGPGPQGAPMSRCRPGE